MRQPDCHTAFARDAAAGLCCNLGMADPAPDVVPESPVVSLVIFVRDLLFSSKVVATARAEGVAFKVVRDVSKLLVTPGKQLVVDFNAPEALDAAVAWKTNFGGRVTGFVAHVDADRIAAARAAGIDRVMTNGAFTASLADIVRAS